MVSYFFAPYGVGWLCWLNVVNFFPQKNIEVKKYFKNGRRLAKMVIAQYVIPSSTTLI